MEKFWIFWDLTTGAYRYELVLEAFLSMEEREQAPITQLLLDWSDGDRAALERVAPLVYGELLRLADHYMNCEGHWPRCGKCVRGSG